MAITRASGGAAMLLGALLAGCNRGQPEPPRLQPPGAAAEATVVPAPAPGEPEEASVAAAKDAAAWPPSPDVRPRPFHERADDREALVEVLVDQGIRDAAVLRAMRTVPRHAFVLPGLQAVAYVDRPLPILGGQTISQPYIVAFMTEAVRPKASSTCLEIGTGSGYQAAVLAELCGRTYSIEYLPEVARFGARNLRLLGYGPERVALRVGDGYGGWPDAAPFDVIVVTAAPERVPEPLLDQLAVGGRLVIPIGPSEDVQELQLWTRVRSGSGAGAFETETLLPVRFVPFAGERAAER